ncbi:hypothetical protein FKR81_37465 [Lentzea tibetensis]|uniref:Chorismate lyase n=1 Tax=Lentzea tibetensis TaxID=2591470 RepID=A0A563EHN1_9PSEU|nr:hypothetical protein [Lentzea tibetensis]TWP46059.1 hypothetical protein FKR81_37465 [Lentzea tibetensis]
MIHTKPVTDEYTARADRLARAIRISPRFLDTLTWWCGFPLRRVPRQPDVVHAVTEDEGLLLNLPMGWEVLRRDGYLVPALGEPEPLAAITSLLYLPRLCLTSGQLAELHAGHVTVGVLTDAPRATHYVAYLGTTPGDGVPALRSRATLSPGGQPAVLVEEIVFWHVLTARAPQFLPHARPSAAAR